MLAVILASFFLSDSPTEWPSAHEIRPFQSESKFFVCADPLASMGSTSATGQVVVLDGALSVVGRFSGTASDERLGSTVVVPREANEIWDFAFVRRRGIQLAASFVRFAAGQPILTAEIALDFGLDARIVETAWDTGSHVPTFAFYAVDSGFLHVSSVQFGGDLGVASSSPTRVVEVDHEVLSAVPLSNANGEQLWLWSPNATIKLGRASLTASVIDARLTQRLGRHTVQLENLPWSKRLVRSVIPGKAIGLTSVRLLSAQSASDGCSTWLRVLAVAEGTQPQGYEANRMQMHRAPTANISDRLDATLSAHEARCVAIHDESLSSEPVGRTNDAHVLWTPVKANWGAQVFDVVGSGLQDNADLVLDNRWSMQLEGRRVELLRTATDSAVFHMRGPSAAYFDLTREKGIVWLGRGVVVKRGIGGAPVILFASRNRIEPWPDPVDMMGLQYEASASGRGTYPSVSVFDFVEWRFRVVGADLSREAASNGSEHATSDGAKP